MRAVRAARENAERKPAGPPAAREIASRPAPAPISSARTLAEVEALLDRIKPWSGDVPEGYVADSLGIFTEGRFFWNRTGPFLAHHADTPRPSLATWGEGFFELADWLLAARDARDRFVGVSLGASFGAQLVFAWKVLMALNPLPCKLVAVEPVPENCAWMRRHMAVNGINPDEHCIIQAALGPDNEPVLFPVGAPGAGVAGCSDTNSTFTRRRYADLIRAHDASHRVLENLLVSNSTGLGYDLGGGFEGEMKFVSAVTVRDVLTPFDQVDLLEVDIQHSEISALPPFMGVIDRKVRRVHIGTHGSEAHELLRGLLLDAGWELAFDLAPDTHHVTELGAIDLLDGILSARNPKV
jgi:hypothetical protein